MKARVSKARMAGIGPGLYVDHRGVHVEVLYLGQDAARLDRVVIYRVLHSGAVMSERLVEFAGIVEAFGERYWRFTALTEPNLFFDRERRAA